MKLHELHTKVQRLQKLIGQKKAITSYLSLPCWVMQSSTPMTVTDIKLSAGDSAFGGDVFRSLLCEQFNSSLNERKDIIVKNIDEEIATLCKELGVEE